MRIQWRESSRAKTREKPTTALQAIGKHLLALLFHGFLSPPCAHCAGDTQLVDEHLAGHWGSYGLVEQTYWCPQCHRMTCRSLVFGAGDEGAAA